jgi:hypothetical protein
MTPNMTKFLGMTCRPVIATVFSTIGYAKEGGHHLPHNHIARITGLAYEETDDGHYENGYVSGIDYIRQFSEHWGWGVAFELEVFGNDQKRHGVLAVPVSYFPGNRWRLFAAPGIEFRERGDPDKAMFRIGAGYELELGKHFTLAPAAQIDFVAGGTRVYVIALALGYGF